MDDRHTITTGAASATVLKRGAELCSFIVEGRELIWQAGPVWPSHAPVLFPIIGELKDQTLTVDGKRYGMNRHGFVRRRDLEWIRRERDSCSLVLTDSEATRAMYPFPFRLELAYTLSARTLTVVGTVTNTGDAPLPCSLGYHPAFNWPLSGAAKEGHRVAFSDAEADTIGRLDAHGLVAERVPNPLQGGRSVMLSEALFADDALVFDPLHSRSARYTAPDGTAVEVSWENAAQLGLWSKPGDFVCIEPWRGVASPAGFTGEFRDKPGLMHVSPGGSARVGMTIAASA